MSEWQPVRIAPVDYSCHYYQFGDKLNRWQETIGKIVRVKRWGIGPYDEILYLIHEEDVKKLWPDAPMADYRSLCEHQIQAD
jgi:hypothetical protein